MTPSELNIYARIHKDKSLEETKEKVTLAYLTALWTIQWLGKKHQQPRPLKEILATIGKERKVMTDEQMLERVKQLNALLGGEVKIGGSSKKLNGKIRR